jgi:hypothetical protein
VGNICEISKYTTAVTASQTSMFFCMATIGNSNRGTVFSVQSAECYKQDSWSNELVVRQMPTGKNVRMEAEDPVAIRHHAITGEYIAN